MADPQPLPDPSPAVRISRRRRRLAVGPSGARRTGLIGSAVLGLCLLGGCASTPVASDPAAASPASSGPTGSADPTGHPAEPAPSSPRPTRAGSTPSDERAAPDRDGLVPTKVEIPAIGLSEPLIGLGLADDGSLEVPEDPGQVAWFDGGSRPGEPGPTTILGHVDSRTGPAVFARLSELAPGDLVELGSADGTRTSYRVDRVEDVAQDDFPTEAVFGATRGDELRLITCTGPWDRTAGYRDNRVVFASAT